MIHNLVLFGATGSIGTSTLNVIRRSREQFKTIGLSCCSNFQKLAALAKEFDVKNIGIWDTKKFHSENTESLFSPGTKFFEGSEGNCELAQLSNVDAIVMAIPGINGILPTLAAIRAKKNYNARE